MEAGSPPRTGLLIAAAVMIVVALPALLLEGWLLHLLAYLVAAPIPFALVALWRRSVVRRREEEGLVEGRRSEAAAWVVLGLGLVVALANGFLFAYEVARL